jgi:hypothetical protein
MGDDNRVMHRIAVTARDFGLLGGVTGLMVPAGLILPILLFDSADDYGSVALCVFGGLAGAALGALNGWLVATLVEMRRRRYILPPLLVLAPLWGMLTFAAAFVAMRDLGWIPDPGDERKLMAALAVGGGLVGASQLGVWVPYALQARHDGRRFPLVLVGCLVSPFLGWLGVVGVAAMIALVDSVT